MKTSELIEYLRKGPVAYMSDSGPIYSGGSLETQKAADLIEAQAKAIEEMLPYVDHVNKMQRGPFYLKMNGQRIAEVAKSLASHSKEGEQG